MAKQLFANKELSDIEAKMEQGERLSFDDGVRLFHSNDLTFIGRLADQVRRRLHGQNVY